MSSGAKVPYVQAKAVAESVVEHLSPYLERVEIAGSIRRKKTWVRDVELVAEPKQREGDLFGTMEADVESIRETLKSLGTWVKGGDRFMQVRDVLGSSLSLDLFLVHPPAEWGSILAIRTGPSTLSQACVTRLKRYARKHEGGRILDLATGQTLPTPTEREFFELAGVAYMQPEYREVQAQRLGMEGR